MRKLTNLLLLFCFIPIILNAQQKNDNIISALVKTQLENEFTTEELNMLQLKVNNFHQSKQSNLEHYYFRQTVNDIEIVGTESSLHLKADGDIFRINNRCAKGFTAMSKSSTVPRLSPIQAVEAAGRHLWYTDLGNLEILEHSILTNRSQKVSKGKLSRREIPLKLVYQLTSEGDIILAWDLSIYETKKEEWWSMRVDAKTGEVIAKDSWMAHCNFKHEDGAHKCTKHGDHPHVEIPSETNTQLENTGFVGGYRVFALPLAHPGEGGRTLVNNPDNAIASPFGWHDTNGAVGSEFTITRGNNVHAYDSGNNSGYSPDGGSGLAFDFPLDLNQDPELFEDAALTNLFYWNNIAHDVLYQYGFDETSGNFQENNYGNSGAGSDYVNARSQVSLWCNATFGTPADGSNPTMNMYICNGRDGDFSNLVILHEYGHGLSNRLTGGPGTSSCLNNAEQMGEGWSDYLGLILTMKSGDQGVDGRPVGDWLFNNPAGIRPYPYSTNMAINPHTYANSFSGTSQPHGIGSVWCAMIWEMTWDLIAQYGFDADVYTGTGGNNIALQLVVEGMKLQPCSPGFVDGRDAILAADQALYGGANHCLIWNAFAKRGLGISADQGSSSNRSDGSEAFDLPDPCDGGGPCLADLTLNGVESGSITHQVSNSITSTQTITPTADVTYHAGNLITLKPGFIAQAGTDFLAKIETCRNFNKSANESIAQQQEPYEYEVPQQANNRLNTVDALTGLAAAPNPFRSTTTLTFQLKENVIADLSIYDINARVIKRLFTGNLVQGNHEFVWSSKDVPPGVYIARLVHGDQLKTIRIVLSK